LSDLPSWLIAALILLAACLLAACLLVPRELRRRRNKAAHEAERASAEAHAQRALNALFAAANNKLGDGFAQLERRVENALKLLGEPNRTLARNMLPESYGIFKNVATRYEMLMDRRSVTDGIVTVHAYNETSDNYTVMGYARLVDEAEAITNLLRQLQHNAYGSITDACVRIEHAAATASYTLRELRERSDEAGVVIGGFVAKGYVLKRPRADLATGRGYLSKAKATIQQRNFLTAVGQLESAEYWINKARSHADNIPQLESNLRQYEADAEQAISQALDRLQAAENEERALARRYSAKTTQPLREQLHAARTSADTLPDQREDLQEKLAAHDLYAAADASREINAILAKIDTAIEATSTKSSRLQHAIERYRQLRPSAVAAHKALTQAVESRQGQTHHRKRRVRELRNRLGQIHEQRRPHPETAYQNLLLLMNDIRDCEEKSRKAHEAALTGTTE
jgi:hypothetical protein